MAKVVKNKAKKSGKHYIWRVNPDANDFKARTPVHKKLKKMLRDRVRHI